MVHPPADPALLDTAALPACLACSCLRRRSLAAVVSVITAGLLLLVYGETKFHLVGFLLVMAAAMLAGLRWTITQVLLQGTPGSAHGEEGVARQVACCCCWDGGRRQARQAGRGRPASFVSGAAQFWFASADAGQPVC
jgi:hypothetical protein